jgi:transposase-like protein
MMSANWIQFQPGMSVSELHKDYRTEAQCEAALIQARWPSGFVCPHCGSPQAYAYHMSAGPGWQCQSCNRQTSLTTGTIFHASKLPLTIWFQAMYFLTQTKNNVAALELKRLLGVSYPTAWRIKHKLMQIMAEILTESVVWLGLIQRCLKLSCFHGSSGSRRAPSKCLAQYWESRLETMTSLT